MTKQAPSADDTQELTKQAVQLGITIDYDTLNDGTVTIRDRDSWQQIRTAIKDLPMQLHKYFEGKLNFEQLGSIIKG